MFPPGNVLRCAAVVLLLAAAGGLRAADDDDKGVDKTIVVVPGVWTTTLSDYVEKGTGDIATAALFDEKSPAARRLRLWVKEAMPKGTTLLKYHRDTGWDGTMAEYWTLNCPSGFAELKKGTELCRVDIFDFVSSYQDIVDGTKGMGVVVGKPPQRYWRLDWKSDPAALWQIARAGYRGGATVGGYIYPHTKGEILYISRISVK